MEINAKVSCDMFPTDSSSSSGLDYPFGDKNKKGKEQPIIEPESQRSCSQVMSSSSTSSTSVLTGFFNSECRLHKKDQKQAPNIAYELAIAKSIMQQYSTLSGDNLFDHLAEIIKRVIDERPPNVIDFFEEFSRNVREQKFHLPERFPPDAIYEEGRMYRVAKKQLLSMKLPMTEDQQDLMVADEMAEEELKKSVAEELRIEIDETALRLKTFHVRVQQLQFYWNQCGFSISSDDIFQIACAMSRLQTHPSILNCRFWGVINGLKTSYYIVEASLTRYEINTRTAQMEQELRDKSQPTHTANTEKFPKDLPSHIGPELTPGAIGWENYPSEELDRMLPTALPVPLTVMEEVFDIPPEAIGLGLNRYSYFVVNALTDDWIELPIVTPKQIVLSRQIKKFLTGDLEAEINAYPCFPGKEKHYLRALIARITAGTYIAPTSYYRKITKREQRLYEGLGEDEMEDEEEEEEEPTEGYEEVIDNDIILLKSDKYDPLPLTELASIGNWEHVRPNILEQGRVVWYDEEKARKEREKEVARLLKLLRAEEMEQEEEEEQDDEEEGEEEEAILDDEAIRREIGPPLLNTCDFDISDEYTVPWIARYTSKFTNKNERVLIMHSNIWPGAYTFTFERLCESIYMGWGHKYVARNMPFKHLPPIVEEFPHGVDDFVESSDPTVAEEEAYRLSQLKKEITFEVEAEQLSEYDTEYDNELRSENEEE